MKLKVFVPKPREDWICDRIIDEFSSVTTHEVVGKPEDADVIFLYAKWIWNHINPKLLLEKPVVTTIHHVVPGKVNPYDYMRYNTFTDIYHVPNEFTEEAVKRLTAGIIPIQKISYWSNPRQWIVTGKHMMNRRNDRLFKK